MTKAIDFSKQKKKDKGNRDIIGKKCEMHACPALVEIYPYVYF